jgi:hypothetical protein
MVEDFHRRGVHVLFPMMMWDQGTRDPGMPWPQAIAETMQWPQGQQTVWTIVNRNEYDVAGWQISVPYTAGMRYYDLYHGTELTPEHEGDEAVLAFPIEAHGYGAVLATQGEPGPEFVRLMEKMKPMTASPLAGYSHEWKPLPHQLVEIAKRRPRVPRLME